MTRSTPRARVLPLLASVLAAAAPANARSLAVSLVAPDAQVAAAVRASLGARPASLGLSLRVTTGAPARGAPPPDLVLVRDAELAAACAAGRLKPIDDNGACGVPGPVERIVLGWDERRDAGGAPGWRDLWELARLPGKRGLPRRAAGTLEIALLADGVAPADIYRTLSTQAGADRAFRKLDQLAPYVVWWRDGPDAIAVLRSGAVLITVAPAAALAEAARQHPGIGLQWADSLAERTSWAIPATAAHPDAARRVLALLRDPAIPPAETHSDLPHLMIDDAFWTAHPALETRFALWLAR